jgi:hypothetical protein
MRNSLTQWLITLGMIWSGVSFPTFRKGWPKRDLFLRKPQSKTKDFLPVSLKPLF